MSPRTLTVGAFLAALGAGTPGLANIVAPKAFAQCTVGGQPCVNAAEVAQANAYTDAAIANATPPPCGVAMPDTLNGSTGTVLCMPQTSATRPTVVQAGNVVTDATAGWTITFAKPFSGNTPYVHAEPLTPGAQLPITCTVYTRTATTAAGRCFQSSNTTLGATLTAIVGTVISPVVNAAANIPVMVIARESTQ